MERFVDRVIRFRWYIAVLIPLVTVLAVTQLKNLGFEGGYRIWFGEDSQILKDYDNFRAVFGNDDAVTIAFKDENGIFTGKALGTIGRITEKLWAMPYIARVDSLTNYQYVHSDPEYPDEVIVEDFIPDPAALTPEALKRKAAIIQGEEQVRGRLVSEDGKTAMIVGRLTPKAEDDPDASLKIKAMVEEIIAPETEQNGYRFHLNGGPPINSAFIQIASKEASIFTPLVVLAAMILLWLIFRRPSAMLMSISVVVFTFLIVLAVQVLLGYKLNNFTANMPVFVVAIGIADAMHLVWIYFVGRKKGMDNREAIHYSVGKNFLPVLLTSLTTAAGFASLAVSPIVPIKTLGIATANAALLAFLLTILFVPAMLAIVKPKARPGNHEESTSHRFSLAYARYIMRHDKAILAVTLLFMAAVGTGIAQVRVDSNTIRYFSETTDVRKAVNFLQENLSGPMTYEIVVDSGEKDGIKSPQFLNTVARFYDEFYAAYPDVRHIGSLLDVVKKFNEVMNHSKSVPDDKNLVAQYLLLYSLSLPQGMEINDRMDVDERLLRVSAAVNIVDTSKDLEMIRWAESWWENTPYHAKVNGQTAMFAYMQSDVTDTLIKSITLAVVVVSLMMMAIFRNPRMIPLFILPNILPIMLVVGVMGWLAIDIDLGVAVSGAIIIGVAVDDTIHFLVKYLEARHRGDSLHDALAYVMQYAGGAIIFTTIVLSTAFLVFVFSEFVPNAHFGIVTASALVIAVVIDLLMLPALLSVLDGRKKSLL